MYKNMYKEARQAVYLLATLNIDNMSNATLYKLCINPLKGKLKIILSHIHQEETINELPLKPLSD